MTNENYTQMSNDELLSTVQNINVSNRRLSIYLAHHNIPLYNEIILRTNFLDDWYGARTVPIQARLYCIKHNLSRQPTCKNPRCEHHNPPVKWMNGENKFRDYCCIRCVNTDPLHQEKMQSTMLKKYGVCHALQSQTFKDKSKLTCKKNNGVDFPSQSSEAREKIRNTNMNNFGVDNPLKSDEIKRKIIQTNNKLYGVDWALQSDTIKDKIKRSLILTYGVENYSQTVEFHKKCHKRYTSSKYPKISFTNSWEFKVYDFLTEHNISFEYQTEPIPYEYDGVTHYYVPDFKVNGRIYEVKGDFFFRINKDTGKEEMFQPFRNPDESDEQYNWACGKEEAKHQCMIANNAIILRKEQIDNLDSVFC